MATRRNRATTTRQEPRSDPPLDYVQVLEKALEPGGVLSVPLARDGGAATGEQRDLEAYLQHVPSLVERSRIPEWPVAVQEGRVRYIGSDGTLGYNGGKGAEPPPEGVVGLVKLPFQWAKDKLLGRKDGPASWNAVFVGDSSHTIDPASIRMKKDGSIRSFRAVDEKGRAVPPYKSRLGFLVQAGLPDLPKPEPKPEQSPLLQPDASSPPQVQPLPADMKPIIRGVQEAIAPQTTSRALRDGKWGPTTAQRMQQWVEGVQREANLQVTGAYDPQDAGLRQAIQNTYGKDHPQLLQSLDMVWRSQHEARVAAPGALAETPSSAPTATQSPAPPPPLPADMTSVVLDVQKAIAPETRSRRLRDGKWGPTTVQRMQQWVEGVQSEANLKVTGVYDPKDTILREAIQGQHGKDHPDLVQKLDMVWRSQHKAPAAAPAPTVIQPPALPLKEQSLGPQAPPRAQARPTAPGMS